jgi:hypothetical protein
LITVLLAVIKIVLIAHDPDDLATLELKALAQNLDHGVGDILATPRPVIELVGDPGRFRDRYRESCGYA